MDLEEKKRIKHGKELARLISLESILYKISFAINDVESQIKWLNAQLKELNELEDALIKKLNKEKS